MVASLLPSIIIFDLDFVLWPFWIDTHVTSPFYGKGTKIVDSSGQRISCYPEVPRIFEMLDRHGITISIVARISDYRGANQLMDAFDWSKYLTYTVTHPGAVTNHFKKLHILSGIPYADMLYFNDEPRDLHQVERMGVLTSLVKKGLDLPALRIGLDIYEKNKTRGPFSPSYKPRTYGTGTGTGSIAADSRSFGAGSRSFGAGSRSFGDGSRSFGDPSRSFGDGSRSFGDGIGSVNDQENRRYS